MKALTASFASGLLFAVGLALSGMTQPQKVVAFLDFTGSWDASLGLVMAGAIAVYLPAFLWARRRARPLLAAELLLPEARPVDARLLIGATLFGVGWGISGFCPGPAIASISSGALPAAVFVLAMVAGNALARVAEAPSEIVGDASIPRTPTCG